jgi:CO/xanthine dehydrogenase FAD-binding subunit
MGRFVYHRPENLEQAIDLLGEAIPLAGGTFMNPRLKNVAAVIDLQDLGLDWIEAGPGEVSLGAMCTLQAVQESEAPVAEALRTCSRLEAGWNLRNVATLGGTLASATARSPLLTALLAAGAEVTLQPGDRTVSLDEYLSLRGMESGRALITGVRIPTAHAMAYEGVARSPADAPIVCAAAARVEAAGAVQIRAALGGWGERPILVGWLPWEGVEDRALRTLAEAGGERYAHAADQWASGEYRGQVAERLLERLLLKVVSA